MCSKIDREIIVVLGCKLISLLTFNQTPLGQTQQNVMMKVKRIVCSFWFKCRINKDRHLTYNGKTFIEK